jgi:hypothetical protein
MGAQDASSIPKWIREDTKVTGMSDSETSGTGLAVLRIPPTKTPVAALARNQTRLK